MLKSRDAGGGHIAHRRVTALRVTVLTKAAATLSTVPTRTGAALRPRPIIGHGRAALVRG